VEADRVSVKATTAKGMGWIGAGEGIACIAVAALAGPPGPAQEEG
jgi:2C-methyl-D-erythritol 2,4-cyclodiphosphate synthase